MALCGRWTQVEGGVMVSKLYVCFVLKECGWKWGEGASQVEKECVKDVRVRTSDGG